MTTTLSHDIHQRTWQKSPVQDDNNRSQKSPRERPEGNVGIEN